jgi:uncharacterized protein
MTSSGWPARVALALGAPLEVRVDEHALSVPAPSAPARALRIAFASDFHASPTTHPRLIENACRVLSDLRPDVLLLGGDFVCLAARYIDELVGPLAEIPAPFGRFAVLGNHDLWTDYRYVEKRLEDAGIEMVTNRNARLAEPFGSIWVCGLDDHFSGTPDSNGAFGGADGVRILLMHSPSGLLDVGAERFDVAFAGHTHGGQVALPGGFPVILPPGLLSRRYSRGVHAVGPERTLIVSRGIGCSTVPFRMWSDPEVHLLTLAAP